MDKKYKLNSQFYNSFQDKKIESLFKIYKVVLPKEYKEFIIKYKVGRNLEKWGAFLDRYYRPTPLYKVKIPSDSVSISYNWLNSIDQILYDLEFYPNALEILESMQLLRIGDLIDSGGLFLGVGKENQGMIFKYFYDNDEAPKFLFASIFEFEESIKLELKDEFKEIKISANKRYSENDSVDFEELQLFYNIETSEYENNNLITAETFLNSLNKVIDDVRS